MLHNIAKKYKKSTLIILLVTIQLIIVIIIMRDPNVILEKPSSLPLDESGTAPYAISAVTFHSTVYTKESLLNVSVDLANRTSKKSTLWLGFSLISPLGEVIDLPLTEVDIEADFQQTLSLSPSLKAMDLDSIISGPYTAVFALWDSNTINDNSRRLANVDIPDAFRLYNEFESFQTIDKTKWSSRNGQLGRSLLGNENVTVTGDSLTIKIPKNTLDGGEIQSIDLMHYGSYEISMKLPDVPSSITGFFLYKAPDYHHEIDIEVFNQPESKVLFTSYSKGTVQHEDNSLLSFDPTKAFHRYRIDYFPDQVAFYIDDRKMQTWKDGFTFEPMHLMVNTWFPKWLPGTPINEDQKLSIEWIRY